MFRGDERKAALLSPISGTWAWGIVCSNAAVSAPTGSWCRLAGCLLSYRAGLFWIWCFLGANWQCGVAAAFTRTIFKSSSLLRSKRKPGFYYASQFHSIFSKQHVEQPLQPCLLCSRKLLFVIFFHCPACYSTFVSLSLLQAVLPEKWWRWRRSCQRTSPAGSTGEAAAKGRRRSLRRSHGEIRSECPKQVNVWWRLLTSQW